MDRADQRRGWSARLGAGVFAAATLWLLLWRLENDLQWRDAAFPGIGVAMLLAGALLLPRSRQS
jgi:peptidoglycan/LPS O-acetylase OafA/YrhL